MNKILFFLVIMLVMCLHTFAITEYAFDKNKDGEPDQWYEYEAGKVLNERLDTNYDGKIDYKAEFDKQSRKIHEEFDINFDGIMDDVYHYEEGKLSLQEIDSNYDGSIDIWIYVVGGNRIYKYEQDTDFDGEIDKVKKIVSGIYLMPSFGRYNMIIDIINQTGLSGRETTVSPVKS